MCAVHGGCGMEHKPREVLKAMKEASPKFEAVPPRHLDVQTLCFEIALLCDVRFGSARPWPSMPRASPKDGTPAPAVEVPTKAPPSSRQYLSPCSSSRRRSRKLRKLRKARRWSTKAPELCTLLI